MVRDQFINIFESAQKESMQLLLFFVTALWQLMPAMLGVTVYFIFLKPQPRRWVWIAYGSILLLGVNLLIDFCLSGNHITFRDFVWHGFQLNWLFIKDIFDNGLLIALMEYIQQTFNAMLAFSFIFSIIYVLIDFIRINPHDAALEALQKGAIKVAHTQNLQAALQKIDQIDEAQLAGTALGVSYNTQRLVIVPDKYVNQVLLVLGTTGGGKSITLRRFYQRAALKGYPLIIVNGKPTEEDTDWLKRLAKKYGQSFYGFNCANYDAYDPLAHGSYTELKDKLISLKDQWENEYYRSIAENYLQTTFAVLQKGNKPIDLAMVANCLDFAELVEIARDIDDEALQNQVKKLEQYEQKDIKGLQAHLNLLIHSELGHYFQYSEKAFSLKKAFAEKAIIHFALPALKYPSFSSVLGKLVINDIKTAIESNSANDRVFCVFDEFSVFAGEQSLNLVNMGRGKGVHAIFGTQGLGEIDKVDSNYTRQLTNCVNTIICHRLNDHASAEAVATWIGTKETHTVTAQIKKNSQDAEMGTVRKTREFIIHPDEIKQTLAPGDAFYVTKIGFQRDRIKVKFS